MDLDSIIKDYTAGIPVRDKLTDFSPFDIKELLKTVVDGCKSDPKMESGMEYFDKAILNLEYGKESSKELPTEIDFFLKYATLTWGYYDTWKATINATGIFVTYKPEHGAEEKVFAIGWSQYNNLINLIK